MEDSDSPNSTHVAGPVKRIVCGSYTITLEDTGNGVYKASYTHVEDDKEILDHDKQQNTAQDALKEKPVELTHPATESSETLTPKNNGAVTPGAILIRDDLPCPKESGENETGIIKEVETMDTGNFSDGRDESSARSKKLDEQRHKCTVDDCVLVFTGVKDLDEHLAHHGEGKCSCVGCSPMDMMEETRTPPTGYRSSYDLHCSNADCQKTFTISISNGNKQRERYLKDGILIRCSSCCAVGQASVRRSENNHVKGVEGPLFVCMEPKCSRYCSSLQGLEYHVKVLHGPGKGSVTGDVSVTPESGNASLSNSQVPRQIGNTKIIVNSGKKLHSHVKSEGVESYSQRPSSAVEKCDSRTGGGRNSKINDRDTKTELKMLYKGKNIGASKNNNDNKMEESETFSCRHAGCRQTFKVATEMYEHEKSHALNRRVTNDCKCCGCTSKKPDKRKTTVKTNYYQLTCGECDEKYVYVSKKATAWRKVYEETGIDILCQQCHFVTKSTFTLSAPHEATAALNQPVFPCVEDKCERLRFTSIPELRRHQTCHSSESVTCEYCQQAIKNRQNLKHHWPTCAGRMNRCCCDICGKKQNNEYHLLLHMRRAHPKVTKLCEECGASFKNTANLRRHRLTHLPPDERPPTEMQTCDLCLKVFSSKVNLKHHIHRTHRAKDKSCDICGKMFKTLLQLKRHRLTHNVHKDDRKHGCIHCTKKFIAKRELDEHVRRVHDCIRDFCEICQKAFRSSLGFKQHMNSHTSLDRQVYSCGECGKLYQSLLGLKLHHKKCGTE